MICNEFWLQVSTVNIFWAFTWHVRLPAGGQIDHAACLLLWQTTCTVTGFRRYIETLLTLLIYRFDWNKNCHTIVKISLCLVGRQVKGQFESTWGKSNHSKVSFSMSLLLPSGCRADTASVGWQKNKILYDLKTCFNSQQNYLWSATVLLISIHFCDAANPAYSMWI